MERKEAREAKSKEKRFQTFTILKHEQMISRRQIPQRCTIGTDK
jgi:hypothetical protein